MVDEPTDTPVRTGRNIVIFSDGTGQRGGLTFDETRSNVYKLYRATRVAPDSAIDPDLQVAFYDPGLGTLQPGGTTLERTIRYIYNFISQATGLGITRNIIDCYAAIIRLWQPGDRIFLFGFSRGAYTVRCLASVICYCGVPTTDRHGKPLCRDLASATRIATRAVKSVYQHVSSPRDQKYTGQRLALARRFRLEHGASTPETPDTLNAYPHFIGVFDTVASLSNTGSLVVLCVAYAALHLTLAEGLHLIFPASSFWEWFGWLAVGAVTSVAAAYVYTHLKFAFGLKGYFFWDVIHLTSFRQKFYDQYLNTNVKYARHAISIDERRSDFQRVPWGGRHVEYGRPEHRIDAFEQFWFAGNHADIGGGYPENESRLSDLASEWMIGSATDPRLADEALLVDPTVLHLSGRCDGMQHDETRSSVFRWAKKTLREPVHDATLHPSVLQRFTLPEVQQYDRMIPYRPEALRGHEKVTAYYADIPLPHVTCRERIDSQVTALKRAFQKRIKALCVWLTARIYPNDNTREPSMDAHKPCLTADSIVSCLGLLMLVLTFGAGLWILVFWQVLPWLRDGAWHSYPLASCCAMATGWIGLQHILDWIMRLPLTLILALAGVFLFWLLGLISTGIYQCANRPAATRAAPPAPKYG